MNRGITIIERETVRSVYKYKWNREGLTARLFRTVYAMYALGSDVVPP